MNSRVRYFHSTRHSVNTRHAVDCFGYGRRSDFLSKLIVNHIELSIIIIFFVFHDGITINSKTLQGKESGDEGESVSNGISPLLEQAS